MKKPSKKQFQILDASSKGKSIFSFKKKKWFSLIFTEEKLERFLSFSKKKSCFFIRFVHIYFLSLMIFSKLRTLQGQRWIRKLWSTQTSKWERSATYLENLHSNDSLFNMAWTPFYHLFLFSLFKQCLSPFSVACPFIFYFF